MKYTYSNLKMYLYCQKINFAALSLKEKFKLWYYAKNAKNIVEIGSYLGGSACIFAKSNPNANIFCVDIWKQEKENYLYTGDIYQQFLNNTKEFKNIIPKRGYSHIIAPYIENNIDLLFIDGAHDYYHVLEDLKNYYPKLNDKAYLLMHDANWLGIRKAIIKYFGTFDYGTILPDTQLYLIIKDDRLI